MVGCMEPAATHPVRSERKDLVVLTVIAFFAVPFLFWNAWARVWPDIEAAVVRVPMRVLGDVALVSDAAGQALGSGGEVAPRVPTGALPDSAVALIRAGEVGEIVAFMAAALVVALLGIRILRRGLFDRRLPTVVRASLAGCFMIWAAAGFLRTLGVREAITALDLGDDYWAGDSGFPFAIFLIFLALVAWFEVILKAGRRIARDQDGII